jgi:hypothetical protein
MVLKIWESSGVPKAVAVELRCDRSVRGVADPAPIAPC